MGKKAMREQKHTAELPIEGKLETEAAYYARKCGITIDDAAKIIRDAQAPKLSIVRKDKSKWRM